MTNILAFRGTEKKGNDVEPFLMFCADGMSSILENNTKQDNSRKLYKIGNAFVMGTGYRNDMIQVIGNLKSNQVTGTPDELSEKVIRIAEQGNIQGRYFNVVVGGKNKDGSLGIRHINASGHIKGKRKTKRTYGDYTPIGVFDGSGSSFVTSLIDVSHEMGIAVDTDSYANAMVTAYEFGIRGAVSSYVNRELQYGIITKDRTVTIMSPRIQLYGPELCEYFNDLLNTSLVGAADPKDHKAVIEFMTKSFECGRTLAEFYNMLNNELNTFSGSRKTYTWTAHEFGEGRCPQEVLDFSLDRLRENRQIVQETVEALVSGDPKQLAECRRKYNARTESFEHTILGI